MSILLPSKPTKLQGLLDSDTGVVIIDGDASSVSVKIDNLTALMIDKFKRFGINTDHTLTSRLEVMDPNGDCIKLFRNGFSSEVNIGDTGDLQIVGTRMDVLSDLSLKGVDVLSTATELNYNHLQVIGEAEPGKAIILDTNMSFSGMDTLSVDNVLVNKSLALDMDLDSYSIRIANSTGKCLQLVNDEWENTFTLQDDGVLNIGSNGEGVDITCNTVSPTSMVYPLQLTSVNPIVGIQFNSYDSESAKQTMSTIETIITDNTDGIESSSFCFNNMNGGEMLNTVTIRNDGYILCNSLMELSDARKKDILCESDMFDSLNKVNDIDIYDFVYKSDGTKTVHKGVMAQELQQVIPSAVNEGDLFTISNKELVGYLIDSVKALTAKIKSLEDIIEKNNSPQV